MSANPLPHAQGEPDPHWQSHRRYLYLLAKVVLIGLAVAAVWQLIGKLSTVVQPLFLSLVIAYLLDPLVDRFEARRIPRSLAIGVIALFLSVAVATLGMVIVPAFVEQFQKSVTNLPAAIGRVYELGAGIAKETFGYSSDEISAAVQKASTYLKDAALGALPYVGNSVNVIVTSLLVPLFVFYLLRDFDTLKMKPLVLVPPRYRDFVLARVKVMDAAVGHWLRGQAQVASILATIYGIGLWLLGVRLGAIIGVATGLLSFIPYVGAGVGLTLSLLMVLLDFHGWGTIVGVLALFGGVQVLDGYLLTPRLVGARVGLHPVLVIVALLTGGALFNFFGVLFAVPVAAACIVLFKDLVAVYQRTSFFVGPDASGAAAPTPGQGSDPATATAAGLDKTNAA